MGKVEISHFPDAEHLAAAAARQFLGFIAEGHSPGRKKMVALSGGRITRTFFASVVEQASQASRENLAHIEFFWADERCVPPDHPESNFRLASECLFALLGVDARSIHRIPGESAPSDAARASSEELVRVAGCPQEVMPSLDLVLLGMGEDGHVASLFPGDPITSADRRSIYLAINDSPKPPSKRVTLGYGPIQAARQVWVLATGPGKEAALKESLSGTAQTPLAAIIRTRDITRILTDLRLPQGFAD
jgi:6-phosphogluconolactonase